MRETRVTEVMLVGVAGVALALGGCRRAPPTMTPEEQQEQQRAQERYERASSSEAEHLEHVARQQAELQEVEEEIALLDEQRSDEEEYYASATRELAEYQALLGEAHEVASRCTQEIDEQGERATEIYVGLARYRSSPERDAAIGELEPCRVALARQMRADMKQAIAELRKEFAEEIEDAFDEANRVRRGRQSFRASVQGSVLSVRMRGNFEGRARHSQDQVDAWCARGATFSRITLRNAHGTFSCEPEESPDDIIDELLAERGVRDSWVPPVEGRSPTPVERKAPTTPFDEHSRRSTLVEQGQLQQQSIEEARAAAEDAAGRKQRASSELDALNRRQATRTSQWKKTTETRRRNTLISGVAIGATGLVSMGVGGYLFQQRRETDERLASAATSSPFVPGGPTSVSELQAQRDRQQRGMIVSLGVGAGLVVVGALLIGIASMDPTKARTLTLRPSGITLRF